MVILWGRCSAGVLRRMNGREIQKAAADFTEAQMKPSNMQNLSTVLNRMIMTKKMMRIIMMTTTQPVQR